MSLELDISELEDGLSSLERRLDSGLFALTEYWASQSQNRLRANAPWTDRTGNARNGLMGRAGREGSSYTVDMFHSVPYGIWLEVRWGGRYSTILPTLQEVSPQVMAHARGLIGRL